MPPIRVHEKALAHLSRGLYRSPASALRELVSNGWDANAKSVRVSTNYPTFYQLAIVDDGDGFPKEEFQRLMNGNIGNSEKRPKGGPLRYGRPTIGRLGIGMLGIAQICGSFVVTSKTEDGTGFRARVHLYDLIKERLDKDDPTLVKADEIDVGSYEFEAVDDWAAIQRGTTIVSDDVHPTFVRAFQQSLSAPRFIDPPTDWSEAVKYVSAAHTLQELGDYWRLLWELATSCPIPYISASSLPDRLVVTEQKLLESYNFRLVVDGIELRKPVLLKGNSNGYTTKKIPEKVLVAYGRKVSFSGYLAVQEGAQLRPDELRGILIRIKNVAIGYYDPSMLDYRYNEGPRSRWLTGEIFVHEGLEDALNIDRDSFNRFHPQFRALQEYLHAILHEQIFPEVYKQIDVRSKARAQTKRENRSTFLAKVLTEAVDNPVQLKTSRAKEETIKVEKKGTRVEVVIPDEATLSTKKSNRQLASAIMAIFEIALKERDTESRRASFQRSLLALLSKW